MRPVGSGRRPPAISRFLLTVLLRHRGVSGESILGDLEEEYLDLAEKGVERARWWYRRQALRIVAAHFADRIRGAFRAGGSGSRQGPGRSAPLGLLSQDLRFALRSLRRRPLFTSVAVLTLGVGIGASTAMFSVVDGVLLKPLAYENPGRLVDIWWVHEEWRGGLEYGDFWDRGRFDYESFSRLREGRTRFLDIAIHQTREVTVTERGEPDRISAGMASSSLLSVLGVRPALGRWFLPEEEASVQAEAASVAVLSNGFWKTRFGGDPDAVGSTVVLDGAPFTIVGVLPPGFRVRQMTVSGDTGRRPVWIPICRPCGPGVNRTSHDWEVIARLAPRVLEEEGLAEARASLVGMSYESTENLRLVSRKEDETKALGSPLALLIAATCLLLIIACGNIATLLLGEMYGRLTEISTRIALGANRAMIVRQLLTESMVVGLMGSAVGILVAAWGTSALIRLAPPIPRVGEVGMDVGVLCCAIGLGMLAGVSFGLAPALMSSSVAGGGASLRSGRVVTRHSRRFQRLILSLEIAMAAVLLVAGGLFLRSLGQLLDVDPGFDPENLATVQVTIQGADYTSTEAAVSALYDVVERTEAIPGVVAASLANGLPFTGRIVSQSVGIIGRETSSDPWLAPLAMRFHALPGYFETMHIPLLAGRTLRETDAIGAPLAMVVSESMANRWWPGESPIGAQVTFWGRTFSVVGVVGDVRRAALDRDVEETVYVSLAQVPLLSFNLVARTNSDPSLMVPQMREAIWSVDPSLPVTNAGTMESFLERTTNPQRYGSLLMGIFGVLASAIAAVGVFGVSARAVSSRTHELGVRITLGAGRRQLSAMVLAGSVGIGLIGTSAGLAAAAALTRLMSVFLFGVEQWDPFTYIVVAGLLMLTCVAASYIPARRVSRIDPMKVIRAE